CGDVAVVVVAVCVCVRGMWSSGFFDRVSDYSIHRVVERMLAPDSSLSSHTHTHTHTQTHTHTHTHPHTPIPNMVSGVDSGMALFLYIELQRELAPLSVY